jgi:signal transduction histidine kinase/ActR/RegA family two-component response regulator
MGKIQLSFPEQYLQSSLFISLLSVWVLVGLFWYLNYYTKREYFTIWTVAWLFYALWLTLGLNWQSVLPGHWLAMVRQGCVAVSSVFLLWGSARFLNLPVRQSLLGLFMLFLLVWTFLIPQVLIDPMQIQLPVFILVGLGSIFAAVCFFRLRRKMPFVGAGMLSLGFLFWGIYLGTYPFLQEFPGLRDAGFLMAAVLQLFIAVSMIVLVLEEVRYNAEKVLAEIAAVRSEKEELQVKILTAEEECRQLYDQVRLSSGVQQAYDELRRTQAVVVQQERLRALGQMASGVAHDINNALSPIVAYSELLLTMQSNLTEAGRDQLEIIQQCGEDISHIVARMREFYRRDLDDKQLAQVDLREFFDQVIELTRPRWRDIPQRQAISIHVKNEAEPHLPKLWCNPADLREALINLVFNAVDALPHDGTINLAARFDPSGQNEDAPPKMILEVRDTGTGMDERTRAHCLEPFFSTKAKFGGTGLGLAMVYGVMQRHGGTVEIDSAPGKGTCVRLMFPIRENPAQSKTGPATSNSGSRSLHLLFIDDEEPVRQAVECCLGRFSHRVITAENGREGIDLFRNAASRGHPFDAVVTDLGMSEMDGRQVARIIKAESKKTPVIMMTGWGSMMKDEGETPVEVDALVSKPAQMKELNEILLNLTAAGSPASNGASKT